MTAGPTPRPCRIGRSDRIDLQHWIANRIRAKRALLLLDTCESGALVGGYARSRIDAPTSEAAIGRLHEATGRPVLTAAAEGKPAFEGYKGHGVFTWALRDALSNDDRNANGFIELSELVAPVRDQVPKIAAMLNGRRRASTPSMRVHSEATRNQPQRQFIGNPAAADSWKTRLNWRQLRYCPC